jgi:hypothetical protein
LAQIDGRPVPARIEAKEYDTFIEGIINTGAKPSENKNNKKPECDKGHPLLLKTEPVAIPQIKCSGEYVNCKDCGNMIVIADSYWMCDFKCDYRVCKACFPARKANALLIE